MAEKANVIAAKVPASDDKRLAALEAEVERLRALMKANGWTV